MELKLIKNMPSEVWDKEAESYATWQVYHSSAWMDFLERTQPVKRHIYAIYIDGRRVGLLPGFTLQKGPLRIFASPLTGWTTPYLGPLVNDIDHKRLLDAIALQMKRERFCYAEVRHPQFNPNIEFAIKLGYKIKKMSTYVTHLQRDPDAILANFSKSCRKAIHRAQRNNLRVETVDDPAFINIYYKQLQEVFTKSKMAPTYPKSRVEHLWNCLMPTGRLIATWVKHEEKIIATRLDLFGRHGMSSFGSASDKHYQNYYPNELARYHVMCIAASRGLRDYDMTGRGTYKAKFGAKIVSTYALVLSPWWFELAKNTAAIFYNLKFRWQYKFRSNSG